MGTFTREASAALFLLLGCAGGGASSRELESLRVELRSLHQENEALARRLDAISVRVDASAARAPHGEAPPRAAAPSAEQAVGALAPVVPPDLAVVKVAPPPRARRVPPPVPTAIPIAEPDAERLDALATTRGARSLAAEAEAELRRARHSEGLDRAHALEDFAGRFPRHPAADNALVEAADAYAAAGKDDPACALARHVDDDYPAGDARSAAVERLAWCASRRGDAGAERRALERIAHEFPRTPAAERAGARLAQLK